MNLFDKLANFVGGGPMGEYYNARNELNPQAAAYSQGIQNFVNLGQGRALTGMPGQAYNQAIVANDARKQALENKRMENMARLARISGSSGDPAQIATFKYLTQGLSQEDAERAARIELGLEKRAGSESGAQVTMIGGVPHVFDPNTKTMVPVSVAGEAVTRELVSENEAAIAAGKESGKAGVQYADSLIEKRGLMNESIRQLDQAYTLLSENPSVSTGVVAGMLPTIQAGSIQLEQLQREMGLNIVGATTFGSLSESELQLALETALPTNLSGPDLKKWVDDKRKATTKLRDELTKTITWFSDNKGKSGADYIAHLEKQGKYSAPKGTSHTSSSGITFTVTE